MYGGNVTQRHWKRQNNQLAVNKRINFAALLVCAKAALYSMHSYYKSEI